MEIATLFGLVFILFQVFVKAASRDYGCTVFCVCDIWFNLKRATCTNQRLFYVEIGITSVMEAVDLSYNSISSLENYELAAAGFTKLRYLNISGNRIDEIGLAAFMRLNDLAVLDLSNNHLNYILPDTFVRNLKLKILKLQKNNFNRHFPILRSSSIRDLDLSNCFINNLPVDAFDNLNNLENLNISKNNLIQLYIKVWERVPSLRFISLERNPWSCTRLTKMTQNYLRNRKIRFIPVCETEEIEGSTLKWDISTPEAKMENPWELDLIEKKNDETLNTLKALNISSDLKSSSTVEKTSLYWFIGIGFLLGSATTLMAVYFWFFAALSCKFFRIQQVDADQSSNSQRISLLQNLWSHHEVSPNSSSSSICPGTPPPAYREVILNGNLYPSVNN